MSRQLTTKGYSERIPLGFFRRCWVSEDQVEVTPPLLLGHGFLFDRVRQVVTIRERLLGFTLSEEAIPFSDIGVRVKGRYVKPSSGVLYPGGGVSPGSRGGIRYFVEMTIAHRRGFEVCEPQALDNKARANRIVAAIHKLGVKDYTPSLKAPSRPE